MGEVGKATSDAVGAHPGATEDDDAFVVGLFEKAEEEFVLLIRRHGIKSVGDGFGGGLAEADFDRDGLFQGPLGETFDFGRDGGREKESLAFFRTEGDDAFDVGQEPHIEHAIHLIQDEVREMSEIQVTLADEVEETSRGGHQNIDATLNLLPLGSIADPTLDESNSQPGVLGEFLQSFRNLVGQFAGWLKDEGAEFPRFSEVLQDGEGESGCFSSARLRGPDDVFSR